MLIDPLLDLLRRGLQRRPVRPAARGIHQIRHVVIIMQGNRSFDSYFGTYRGADGIPARNGQFTVCVRSAHGRL